MVNQAYIRQLSNESENINMVPKQHTLPHPLPASLKHPKLHRSHSNQQPSKTYHHIGRQQSLQVPSRLSVGIRDDFRFHPTTPVVVNARGPMTQMTLPVRAVKPSAKGMTYSLDRRHKNMYQSLHHNYQLYQDINGNIFIEDLKQTLTSFLLN